MDYENLLPYIISAAAVISIFLFKRILAKGLVSLIFVRMKKRDNLRYRNTQKALLNPAAYVLVSVSFRAVLEFISFAEPYYGLVCNLSSSVLLIVVFWTMYTSAGLYVKHVVSSSREKSSKIDANAANYLSSAIKILIVVIGVFSVLSRWVSDISGLITGLGIGGLAVALAAQETASNLIGSFAIMMDKPFEIGDWVEFDGVSGIVLKVGLRSSQIRAMDQTVVSIPNSKLAGSTIVNGARRSKRRVVFKLGIPLNTSSEHVQSLIDNIKALLVSVQGVEKENIIVALDGFTQVSIEIFISYYTPPVYSEMVKIKEQVNYGIIDGIAKLNISLAIPSIHVIDKKN